MRSEQISVDQPSRSATSRLSGMSLVAMLCFAYARGLELRERVGNAPEGRVQGSNTYNESFVQQSSRQTSSVSLIITRSIAIRII